ncbi:MAG: hypothetical protein KDB23_00635, partial [Planctomycetales bacterium]|nr:hypothetical protein [Planctomycetales bacterium]
MMSSWGCEPILDSYALIAAAIGILIALLFTVRPALSASRPPRVRALMALRAFLILLLLLAMLRPTHISRQTRPQSATLVMLVDQSRSMSIKDGAAGRSRWLELNDVMRRSQSKLSELSELMEVRAYAFDMNLRDQLFENHALKMPRVANGEQTDFATAMHDALRSEAGKRLAGVILLSDGALRAYSPQYDAQQIARELARTSTPLYTVPFGKPREQSQSRDIAVERLQDQYTVFVKNELQIRGALRVNGYVNQPIPVQLIAEGPAGAEQNVLGPVELRATQDDELVEFEFNFTPEIAGAYRLRVEAKPQEGELVVANNEMTAYLNVLEGGLRVLFLDGNLLGPEQKILRRSLAASPDIELDFKPIDARLQPQWPVDLSATWSQANYDVIVLGDVPAQALGPANCQQIATLIENGRGLLMLGGINTYGPGGYLNTPIENLLPMKLSRFQGQEFGADKPVRADQHLPGPLQMKPSRNHFITHLADRADNEAAWSKLKPLLGANKIVPLTPQAIRLAESQNGDPLLVARQYGTGRVLVFAGDSTYLWWLGGQQAAHRRFWRQAILWLASRDELLRRDVWVNL